VSGAVSQKVAIFRPEIEGQKFVNFATPASPLLAGVCGAGVQRAPLQKRGEPIARDPRRQ
jgi:hypothetical protein